MKMIKKLWCQFIAAREKEAKRRLESYIDVDFIERERDKLLVELRKQGGWY